MKDRELLRIGAWIRAGHLREAERWLERALVRAIDVRGGDMFASMIGVRWAAPAGLLSKAARFVRACRREFPTHALLLVTNELDCNTHWCVDFVAYDQAPDADVQLDGRRPSGWRGHAHGDLQLTGLTAIRRDFSRYVDDEMWDHRPSYAPSKELAMYLAMVKYVVMVEDALAAGRPEALSLPVIAASFGFDMYAWFPPPL